MLVVVLCISCSTETGGSWNHVNDSLLIGIWEYISVGYETSEKYFYVFFNDKTGGSGLSIKGKVEYYNPFSWNKQGDNVCLTYNEVSEQCSKITIKNGILNFLDWGDSYRKTDTLSIDD
jgi:hypothetical protein